MFDIFKSLPGVTKSDDGERELTKDEIAAEEKAERIKFHRERVRNGPVNFKAITNGQIRRAQARAEANAAKKARRAEIRNHLEKMRFASVLRGQLAVAGAIPSVVEYGMPRQVDATVWIVRRFGVSVDRVDGPAYASFKQADVVSALRNAVDFYNRATGAGFALPSEDFEPAIYEVEDAA